MEDGANITYSTNSFTKVAKPTEDGVGSQSWPIACNTVKYVMYSKSHTRQRFTGTDYTTCYFCKCLL